MMWMDMLDGDPMPRRGDRIRSPKTTYYVLTARAVKRRDPNAPPRCMMRVLRMQDMPEDLRGRLLRSAMRRPEGSRLFPFYWYPRQKKKRTFEDLMRRPL